MRFIRKPELEARIGLCERIIRDMEAAGTFPRRITLNPPNGRAVAWAEDEVNTWIKTRIEAREAA